MTDQNLQLVIARVESGNNPLAIRFEPATYGNIGIYSKSVQNAMVANACSSATASMLCATSWGAYQLMGFNVCGDQSPYRKIPILSFATSRSAQDEAFGWFLETIHQADTTLDQLKLSTDQRVSFISKYNGPGNIDAYWQQMQKAIAELGV